jgi:hypothetical protein
MVTSEMLMVTVRYSDVLTAGVGGRWCRMKKKRKRKKKRVTASE